MSGLAHGQERALGELVSAGALSQQEADAVRTALTEAEPTPVRRRIAEVVGYLGAALLLAGASPGWGMPV